LPPQDPTQQISTFHQELGPTQQISTFYQEQLDSPTAQGTPMPTRLDFGSSGSHSSSIFRSNRGSSGFSMSSSQFDMISTYEAAGDPDATSPKSDATPTRPTTRPRFAPGFNPPPSPKVLSNGFTLVACPQRPYYNAQGQYLNPRTGWPMSLSSGEWEAPPLKKAHLGLSPRLPAASSSSSASPPTR